MKYRSASPRTPRLLLRSARPKGSTHLARRPSENDRQSERLGLQSMNASDCYDQVESELTDFGKNAVADVGKIMTLVQALDLPEKDVMPTVQYIYITHYQKVNAADANQARQSWVTASGNNFESFMRNFINLNLNSEGILAVKGDRLKTSPKAVNIVSFLTLRANRRCTQTTTGVWPDSDIVVLTREKTGTLKAFALLNCKTSDHSRNDAVLFWALALSRNDSV